MMNAKTAANNNKIYLVTGSNVGLGLEAAKQLALKAETAKVYLACRTESKALSAIDSLVNEYKIPKDKLAFAPFDGSANKETISTNIINALPDDEKLDGLIFNAGGMGYDTSGKPAGPNHVLDIFQINLIGHIHLLEALKSHNHLKENKTVIVVSGSELARGSLTFGMSAPKLPSNVEGYKQIIIGEAFKKFDVMKMYANTKAIAALYFGAWACKNPEYHVLTVSPGATRGTAITKQDGISSIMKVVFPIFMSVLAPLGVSHKVEEGAKRYVDAVNREGAFEGFASGTFVASASGATGRVIDQSKHRRGAAFADEKSQNLAYEAVQSFI